MIYIFDLDGTIADNKHREHLIKQENPDWDAYYLAAGADTPIWPVRWLIDELCGRAVIKIWSGRGEVARDITVEWLGRHNVLYDQLLMRPSGDFTPDTELKERWYHEMAPAERNSLAGVFEDRNSVVKMWRGLGVACFQVAEGDF